jgi:hypothetical protein
MAEVAVQLPVDEANSEMVSRPTELRQRKVPSVPWRVIKAKRAMARRK